ncbi:hypothetical protein NEF87_001032 [Candidatus Lokiarchaeum ossiferum]|uniref:Uncharacterized protein n=1 Tax=Candidatus Lokiarchaeum ossiferum TaxID=2951803 RepID=A0ABY6HML8_9ARCH|nr:hypothetical protein NEF87_001032 [Candidatus Lokiarchaeum sp. B-35]
MTSQKNKFRSDGTDGIRRAVIKFYRNHVYGAYNDILEWTQENKIQILDLLQQEFQDCDSKTIESIMDSYYSDF